MAQIYGEFPDHLPDSDQFLVISFCPSSASLKQHWRTSGLSANFVADYLTTFFPVNQDDPSTFDRQNELKSAVSYIANELLENSVKFHTDKSIYPIQFGIHLLDQTVILFSTNHIDSDQLINLEKVINELVNSNLGELYIQKMEQLAEAENNQASGLGLLTIMSDYSAQLGWKIEAQAKMPELTSVTTMVQITF